MPYETPFHPRTAPLCRSYAWKEWAGYAAVCRYDVCHESEYHAVRHGAGLFDVTPLYKYDLRGPDAGALLSYITVREVSRMKVGRVAYLCWCDDDGKLLDDGTVARLAKDHYRLTANAPSYAWLAENAEGFDVTFEETTRDIAALALQGPNARGVLEQITDCDLQGLRYFRLARARFEGELEGVISRTGYTGDLGYELWVASEHALALWDALIAAGRGYALQPCGLDALDMLRIEAGFVLHSVDYASARACVADWQKSSPFEAGLGFTVRLDRAPFIGQRALRAEVERGEQWAFVGLEIDWEQTEQLFDSYGLAPQLPAGSWRATVPIYLGEEQVGRASSGTWSPLLKRNLALATVRADCRELGSQLEIEMTAEYRRHRVGARVVERPFFDPERKKA